ncbi:hypothetical protein EC991_005730 [Linnemannia zychae]|nr:hypothetical protein EC991_005730 [Linnemannia zychae]
MSTPIKVTPAIKAKVDDIIAKHAIVVFSKSTCPYCTTAKNLLNKHHAKTYVHSLDNEEGKYIQAYLAELTKQSTVPNIFISQKHIGGCDSLQKLESNGQLAILLAKI